MERIGSEMDNIALIGNLSAVGVDHNQSQFAVDVLSNVEVAAVRCRRRAADDAAESLHDTGARPRLQVDHLRRGKRMNGLLRLVGLRGGRSGAGRDGVSIEAERVLAGIRELPEAYHETLVLRLVEGLTGPQIAAALDMTHGSVRVNLTRGMEMLREYLGAKSKGGEP